MAGRILRRLPRFCPCYRHPVESPVLAAGRPVNIMGSLHLWLCTLCKIQQWQTRERLFCWLWRTQLSSWEARCQDLWVASVSWEPPPARSQQRNRNLSTMTARTWILPTAWLMWKWIWVSDELQPRPTPWCGASATWAGDSAWPPDHRNFEIMNVDCLKPPSLW